MLAALVTLALILPFGAPAGRIARADDSTATATVTDTPTPTATATTTPTVPKAAAPRNIVKVTNQSDNQLQADGRVQLNHLPGDSIAPVNEAYAYASCTSCQTYAVALQIDLVGKTLHYAAPQNVALAVNYKCNQCTTVAKAYQYVIQESNPHKVPGRVNQLVDAMNRELDVLHSQHITAAQAETDIQNVIDQFSDLAQYLQTERSQETKARGKQKHVHHGHG